MITVQEQRQPSFSVRIYIAGNLADAERICRQFCYDVGHCVTVSPTEYIYTGGQESGVIVGLINYPRFPKTPEQLMHDARILGVRLMDGLSQHSFGIEAPDETIWISRRPA